MKKIAFLAALLSLVLCSCSAAPDSVPAAAETTEEETAAAVTEEETETQSNTEAAETETEEPETEPEKKALNYTDMKALWISQFDMSSIYVKD